MNSGQDQGRTWYEVLDVPTSASDSEIARAYRRKLLETQPTDDAAWEPETRAEMAEEAHWVREAWRVLGSAASRRAYDQALAAWNAELDGDQPPPEDGRPQAWEAPDSPIGHIGIWNMMYYASLGLAAVGAAMLLFSRGCAV